MATKRKTRTEDQVRDSAKLILGFDATEAKIQQGTGQITTFNQLGFKGVNDKPDGWYLPDDHNIPAIILETKSEAEDITLQKWVEELFKNCNIVAKKYKQVVGILYNGVDIRVFKNNIEETEASTSLQNKAYYISLFTKNTIDKQRIYNLTKKINDCLHTEFGIKNLYHRMIFTACALVAKRYEAILIKGMSFSLMKTSILSTLNKSLEDSKKQNMKLDLLTEVYGDIKMNNHSNQEAIDNFISWVSEISECVNSDYWNGEDVMGIFFNEFNRYKKKSESGQVFTPDHITSFMYRLIEVGQNDRVLDAACGSGAFLVKSMCNMIKESGGLKSKKASEIKDAQLFGIEFDREIFALACANMLIHKDGKTNLEQLDTRSQEACDWIKSKSYKRNKKGEFEKDENGNLVLANNHITKVLMNPPFERKYGCMQIVQNVLDNVPTHTDCAFILPDKKLEKDFVDKKFGNKVLKNHSLKKIIKLPENIFSGTTTSIFIFESGIPQNSKEIFTCYIEDDGLETVKNQGRQDIKDRWQSIEDAWVEIIRKQSGNDTIKWVKPSEHLSYQMPKKEAEITDKDFNKTMMDYLMFKQGIDIKEFKENLINKVMYDSSVLDNTNGSISILLENSFNNLTTERRLANYNKQKVVQPTSFATFKIDDLFVPLTVSKKLSKANLDDNGKTPVQSSETLNNGIIGLTNTKAEFNVNKENPLYFIFGDHTKSMHIADYSFCVMDNVKVLKPKTNNALVILYIATLWKKEIPDLGYSRHWSIAKNATIKLPVNSDKKLDVLYIEKYMENVQKQVSEALQNLYSVVY